MNMPSFDTIATITSRRGIVGAAGAGLAAALAVLAGRNESDVALAKRKKKGKKSPPAPAQRSIAFADVDPNNSANHRTSDGVSILFVGTGTNQTTNRVYCFQLPFRPIVAVGSPNVNNNAVVATVTQPDADTVGCPETHADAAARTYAANDPASTPRADVNFRIVFL